MANAFTIDNILAEIAGQPRFRKLEIIRQARIDYGLLPSTHFDSEKDYAERLDVLLHELENDTSYMDDCDWNWFFNADNIPNQDLVFSTKDFLEANGCAEKESLTMMNLVLRQMEDMKLYLDKPIEFVARLHSLPLDDSQKHTLFGLLLKWHGGYPINNLNPKYNTILKLIEREFFKMFPDSRTPEKEFCATDIKTTLQLKEAAAHVHAELKKKYSFTESRYITKVDINFDDLPEYIIQRGIIWKFESDRSLIDKDFLNWKQQLLTFLETIPNKFILNTLQKGIEYANKVYAYHLHNECTDQSKCVLNQSWERRIAIAESILAKLNKTQTVDEKDEHKPDPDQNIGNDVVPIINLSEPERRWLKEVYRRTKKGERFSFKDIWSALHNDLPATFQPKNIDRRLIDANGEEIKLLGVIALEKNVQILSTMNKVVQCIRKMLLDDHESRKLLTSDIADKCFLSIEEISLVLSLLREFGPFYSGSGFDAENKIFKSIDIGGSDAIYYNYIQFPGMEELIRIQSDMFSTSADKPYSIAEQEKMNEKLDAILAELSTLKSGQEIIWMDFLNEIEELKENYRLSKKNWRQLFAGKLMEMTASGVISETVSKRIVEVFKPTVEKLIGV